jgi:uncharacterized Fe-S cluster-containing MiaB family protein
LSTNIEDAIDASVLTDDVPAIEKMYLDCALEWRKGVNESFTKGFIREGVN